MEAREQAEGEEGRDQKEWGWGSTTRWWRLPGELMLMLPLLLAAGSARV